MEPRLVDLFRSESKAYFDRNYGSADLRTLPLDPYIDEILAVSPIELSGRAVLELGCAAGKNLHQLRCRFGVTRTVGTEPSSEVVDQLSRTFPETEFVTSDSRSLPFATGEFDLVILRNVLHWIDREYLLQALGEAVRVTCGHILVSDFAPAHPYSTTYHHQPSYRTFKQSYGALLHATGLVSLVTLLVHDEGNDWDRNETGLYRKWTIDEGFPLRTAEDVEPPGLRG